MKILVGVIVLSAGIALFPALAKDVVEGKPDATKASATEIEDALIEISLREVQIDEALAPIKSRKQLVHYLANTPNSPLSKLPVAARKSFFKKLVFTDSGLGSYSYLELAENLSVTDIYRVLREPLKTARAVIPAKAGIHFCL